MMRTRAAGVEAPSAIRKSAIEPKRSAPSLALCSRCSGLGSAKRAEGLSLGTGKRRERASGRAGRAIEKRVRPGLTAEPPAENQPERARDEAQVQLGRAVRRRADRKLTLDRADGLAEDIVGPLERLRDDSYEGDGGAESIAERRFATARVPPVKAFGREAKPDDALDASIERERCGATCTTSVPAVRVQEIGATDVVEIRLAVIAITDGAAHGLGRCVRDVPADLPQRNAAPRFDSWKLPPIDGRDGRLHYHPRTSHAKRPEVRLRRLGAPTRDVGRCPPTESGGKRGPSAHLHPMFNTGDERRRGEVCFCARMQARKHLRSRRIADILLSLDSRSAEFCTRCPPRSAVGLKWNARGVPRVRRR